jgi:phosphoribosylformimino-5-aminoimidazole carboxamide ribotide isomerase
MKIIPAIDLIQRKVVRLTKGDPNQATFYDSMGTPVDIAKKWQQQGASRLHIIDLDAAFGKPDNLQSVTEIANATNLPLQVGGGIRSVEAVERLLNAGIQHVILGSLAIRDPAAVTELQKKYGADRIIVALDHRNGNVMIGGWTSGADVSLIDALAMYVRLGAKTFLITSITRDGTLSGPDLETMEDACNYPGAEVIAAGGIGSLRDLAALKRIGASGVVVGKALYEGRFSLKEAIETLEK